MALLGVREKVAVTLTAIWDTSPTGPSESRCETVFLEGGRCYEVRDTTGHIVWSFVAPERGPVFKDGDVVRLVYDGGGCRIRDRGRWWHAGTTYPECDDTYYAKRIAAGSAWLVDTSKPQPAVGAA